MDLENKYGTLEVQKASVELLRKFSRWAKNNGVQYSLVDGSMLGAVRHQGYIPWDDDIDIIVDRATFQKLASPKVYSEGFEIMPDLWFARIRSTSCDCGLSYPPTIDIFCLDKAPNGAFVRKIKLLLVYMMQGMLKENLSLKKGNWLMKTCSFITWLMGRPFSYKTKFLWYGKISQLWGGNKYKQCYNTIFEYIPTFFDENVMNKYIDMQFEDMKQPIMSRYDHWLTRRYGDYMTPPKDKTPKHIG